MQPYELIRSGRRTLALEVRGGHVIVRAPYRTSQATIDRFVAAHTDWIAHALAKQEARAAAHPEPTDAERAAYIRQAKAYLPQRVRIIPSGWGFTRRRCASRARARALAAAARRGTSAFRGG